MSEDPEIGCARILLALGLFWVAFFLIAALVWVNVIAPKVLP